jgi:hypothetical protein
MADNRPIVYINGAPREYLSGTKLSDIRASKPGAYLIMHHPVVDVVVGDYQLEDGKQYDLVVPPHANQDVQSFFKEITKTVNSLQNVIKENKTEAMGTMNLLQKDFQENKTLVNSLQKDIQVHIDKQLAASLKYRLSLHRPTYIMAERHRGSRVRKNCESSHIRTPKKTIKKRTQHKKTTEQKVEKNHH